MSLNLTSDNVLHFLDDLAFSIVAESGIATDRYHIGKMLLRSMKATPDFVMQIDGSTGESDTFRTAMDRSVRCAICLENYGLKSNDVIVIMAPNGIDLTMPLYASFYMGLSVAAVDMTLGTEELHVIFQQVNPKIVFCQIGSASNVEKALMRLNNDSLIVTFGKIKRYFSFREFLKKYAGDSSVDDYRPTDFDPTVTNAMLMATSGTTGLPKVVALTYENIYYGIFDVMTMYTHFPEPFKIVIVPSPLQWLTATLQYILSPILRYTRVQTSSPTTTDHLQFLINKYRPSFIILNPIIMAALLRTNVRDKCDFSSLQHVILAGSASSKVLKDEVKKVMPNAVVYAGYGMTEASGFIFDFVGGHLESSGKLLNRVQCRLVDYETQEDILGPNKPGELLIKGKSVFKGYYKKPEVTAEVLTEDGWLKTGDIFYRDENFNFFFVDRLKLLLKYNNHHVSPVEIESVISKHPGVFEVAVTGIPDPDHGELPVAFVVPHDGFKLTAQEIKNIVKDYLTDYKQLRGGVIFVNELPKTASGKIKRSELKSMITTT